jgi:hypothetical protein
MSLSAGREKAAKDRKAREEASLLGRIGRAEVSRIKLE